VEDVEVVGAVLGEQRGDERIGHGFESSVGQGKDEGPDIQEHVGGGLGLAFGRGKSDERRQHMEQEGRDDQLAVADLVHDHAADDDAKTESGEAGPADGPELRAGEAEVGGPVGQDSAADAEADAGGENGQKAGPKKPFCVRGDARISSIAHS
jgi:hypothetical protein